MPTVTKSTGSSGTMKIEDDGTHVTFWLKAASGTFNHDLPWGYTANGVTNNSRQTDFVGSGSYQLFATFTVSTDQTVYFRLFDSDTSGIGGPTTLTMAINRASAPPAPTTPTTGAITNTTFNTDTNSNGDGGAAIDLIQIGIGTTTAGPTLILTANSSGFLTVTGRTPGATYYVWARYHNSEGYSPWSGRAGPVVMLNHPAPPSTPVLSEVTQTSVRVKFTDGATGGSPIIDRGIWYSTTLLGARTGLASDGDDVITGLTPGQTYYFWATTTNTYGDSDYSPPASVRLLAGAKILVGAVYKDAVPYVRSGGVWKVAEPFVRQGGFWKEGL